MNASTYQKNIAKNVVLATSADKYHVFNYVNDNGVSIDIMEINNNPSNGISTYATIGLSAHPLFFKGKELPVRAEIVGVCFNGTAGFDNVLATLSFSVINSNWFCAPGIIFPDVVAMYGLSKHLTDIFFTYPYLWGENLQETEIDGQKIGWLLAIPISKSETDYAVQHGPDKLEDLFEAHSINIFDLNRPSVV